MAWFQQHHPPNACVWFPPKPPANPVLQGAFGLGHWVLSKNPQATADHHTQARVRFYNESRAESIFWAGFVLCCNPYLSDFHKKQLWGFKTGFGALVLGHPFAWVHISLGSTVLPKPPPKPSFGGLKLILGHLLRSTVPPKPPPQNQFWVLKTGYLFRVTPLLGCISHWVLTVPPIRGSKTGFASATTSDVIPSSCT